MSFLWISYIASAISVSFTANFPIIRIALLVFTRFVFAFYIISFKPYKRMLSNIRIIISEIVVILLILIAGGYLFYKNTIN